MIGLSRGLSHGYSILQAGSSVMKQFFLGAITALSICVVLSFLLFGSPYEQPTFFEANVVEHSIWARTSGDKFPFFETYDTDLAIICVFPNTESTVRSMLKAQGFKYSSVLRGSLNETEQEELAGVFRIVLISKAGQAEIWKFDERRFGVSLADRSDKFGCVNANSFLYSVNLLSDGIYQVEVKPDANQGEE
jgi:hypothetical protein